MSPHLRQESLRPSRRDLVAGLGALGAVALPKPAAAARLRLDVAVRSPWLANGVALTSGGELFLSLPRTAPGTPTPSVARRTPDGRLVAFPGGAWNAWTPGDDGRDAFVYVNAVHVFADDTLWCVDWGAPGINTAFPRELTVPRPGAQKLVRLHTGDGRILEVLRFDATILPPGAQMNDLRFHGSRMYVTDSGLGGLIVHDRGTGRTLRRLSGRPVTMAKALATPMTIRRGGATVPLVPPNSDLIEISADGAWLYWAAPTGPFFRAPTALLDDPSVPDAVVEAHVEHVADIAFSSGSAMDTRGNLYLSETRTTRLTLLSPDGRTAVLASDPTLLRPDGGFIGTDRRLYVPIKEPLADAGAASYVVYAVDLPTRFDGIPLGDAVTGRA